MGRRKKIVQECERLMDEPENIRNIAIAAHVDHGKCIAGSTQVSLADGAVLDAEELYETIRATGEAVDQNGDAYAPTDDLQVVSLDRTTGETVAEPVTFATRRAATEPLVEITTSTGADLATTPEHRYLVLSDHGVMEFERADALKAGDTIVGARQLPAGTPETETRAAVLDALAADPDFYGDITPRFTDRLTAPDIELPPAAADALHDGSDVETVVSQRQSRLTDLVTICRALDIALADLYDAIETLIYRPSTATSTSPPRGLTLPANLDSLFYLAGSYLATETSPDTLPTGEHAPQTPLREAATDLDPTLDSFADEGDAGLDLAAMTGPIPPVIATVFVDPTAASSATRQLPQIVFTAPDSLTAAFIRGYLDLAGHVAADESAIIVDADSTQVLTDLQLLLYRFDVASTLDHDTARLSITGELSLSNFTDIGFSHPDKHTEFTDLLAAAPSAAIDHVPIDGETLHAIRDDAGIDSADMFDGYDRVERNDAGITKPKLATAVDHFASLGVDDIRLDRLENLAKADTSFIRVDAIDHVDREYVYDFGVETHRNFVANGLVVHNTTLTDNLLAGAGMISDETAGEQLAMDTEEDEQERGITIDAANVSMTHEYEGTNHLINLIDTPGHVDFGGDVTRAMRAVDGALVVVDAVEGAMPQTETVLRQALREGVKPTLFINKVDRLISELQEGPDEMQNRLMGVIRDVNELIHGMTEEMADIDEDWTVSVEEGTVGFGSALYKWGVSMPSMQQTGMDFGDIMDLERADKRQELHERTPLADVVLDMVCEHFPNPIDAQPRRIPRIWRGDADSEIADTMRRVDEDGELVLMVTDIGIDPHAGEIAAGRVFSGTIEKGQELYVSGTAGTNRVQSVGIYMGGEREEVDRVPAGNIAAVTGLRDAIAGSTVSSIEMTPFETIEHISEPVITKSVEAQSMDDLPKLIETLQQVAKEDPTIQIEINEDTGEHLMSGQGELHLEVITQRIERNQGIPVNTGEPIVVYREAPQSPSREVEGRSPNNHNRFYLTVEPLTDDVVEAIKLGDVSMDMPELERREELMDNGVEKDTAQNLEEIHNTNLFIDDTKGIQHLNETMELVVEGIEEALDEGPLAAEPVEGALIRLQDARLHEDAIHRGPAQVIPAVRQAAHNALIDADIRLLEPIQEVRIDVPNEHMGAASGEIQGRRGRVDDMYQEGDLMVVEGIAPVDEMIGFSSDIRSATEGRASWNTENAGFRVLADNLQPEVITEIRERKGMKTELPAGVDYF